MRVAPGERKAARPIVEVVAPADEDAHLDDILGGLRWLALGAVFLLGLLDRSPGRLGISTPQLVLLVAGYNAAAHALRTRLGSTVTFGGLAVLDVAVVSVADIVGGRGSSPIFLLYLPALIGAAICLRPADSGFLTFAVALLSTSVAVTQPDWAWRSDQLQFLGVRVMALVLFGVVTITLSRQLGLQRWTTERERSAGARLALLNDLLRATSSRLELHRVVETIAAMTRRGIGSDVAVALLLEPGEALPKAWASGDIAVQYLLEGSAQLARAVSHRGQALQVADTRLLPETRPFDRLGLRSLLATPLEADGRILGALLVASRAPGAFSRESLDWLLTISQHAVLPIRNARLREMERANAVRLAELERAKSSFLSGISHDLRTPLTSIKVAAGLLTEQYREETDESGQALLASLRRNTERLEKLVDEILDVVRLQSGALRLRPELVDIPGLVREVALGIKPMFDARGQRLELTLPEQPVEVWADRRRIEQVVANLIANAHKYSPDGSTIVVSAEESGTDLLVGVADEGPGVPVADRERVFQPFFRIARDEDARSGVGLGLAIARSLVELHGGRIWLADGRALGARVVFTLPRRPHVEGSIDEGPDH